MIGVELGVASGKHKHSVVPVMFCWNWLQSKAPLIQYWGLHDELPNGPSEPSGP